MALPMNIARVHNECAQSGRGIEDSNEGVHSGGGVKNRDDKAVPREGNGGGKKYVTLSPMQDSGLRGLDLNDPKDYLAILKIICLFMGFASVTREALNSLKHVPFNTLYSKMRPYVNLNEDYHRTQKTLIVFCDIKSPRKSPYAEGLLDARELIGEVLHSYLRETVSNNSQLIENSTPATSVGFADAIAGSRTVSESMSRIEFKDALELVKAVMAHEKGIKNDSSGKLKKTFDFAVTKLKDIKKSDNIIARIGQGTFSDFCFYLQSNQQARGISFEEIADRLRAYIAIKRIYHKFLDPNKVLPLTNSLSERTKLMMEFKGIIKNDLSGIFDEVIKPLCESFDSMASKIHLKLGIDISDFDMENEKLIKDTAYLETCLAFSSDVLIRIFEIERPYLKRGVRVDLEDWISKFQNSFYERFKIRLLEYRKFVYESNRELRVKRAQAILCELGKDDFTSFEKDFLERFYMVIYFEFAYCSKYSCLDQVDSHFRFVGKELKRQDSKESKLYVSFLAKTVGNPDRKSIKALKRLFEQMTASKIEQTSEEYLKQFTNMLWKNCSAFQEVEEEARYINI